MNLEKYLLFTTEDFALDPTFISWVLHPRKESDHFWTEFLMKYPHKRTQAEEAAYIIRALQPAAEEIPDGRLDDLFLRIQSKSPVQRRRVLFPVLKYAAVITGVIGITGLLYLKNQKSDIFPTAKQNSEVTGQGKIILSDGSSIGFDTEETVISQTTSGMFLINSDTVNISAKESPAKPAALNQIIIPYGKHSQVTLSDGTHIWLNSGSQLSYPSDFAGNIREVYLSGEAIFDVSHDTRKPFYVITKDIKIKVLGTRFNVSAYDNEPMVQTVLLEGRVTIGKNAFLAKTIQMEPGERVVYNQESEDFAKDKVDVNYYTSWLYGYLIFENEPTPEVFRKLERYYNQPIVVEAGLDGITFSGKLDLKEDIVDVLESITYSSGVKITREGEVYKVNR